MKRRGTSIIETIMYVALLATVTGVLLGFTISIMTRATKVRAMLETSQNTQFAMQKMDAAIRNSRDATVPLDGGGSGPVLSLDMPDESLSPTVFAVTDGVLTMRQGSGPAVPITSAGVRVTGLNFQNLVDPVAHARTSHEWTPCDKSIWFGVCCYKGKEHCWDAVAALFHILFKGAKAGSCTVATAAKSVIRYQLTVSSPAQSVGAEWSSSVTSYGTATVPRQN
jgi:hypothetical protein